MRKSLPWLITRLIFLMVQVQRSAAPCHFHFVFTTLELSLRWRRVRHHPRRSSWLPGGHTDEGGTTTPPAMRRERLSEQGGRGGGRGRSLGGSGGELKQCKVDSQNSSPYADGHGKASGLEWAEVGWAAGVGWASGV